MTLRNNRRLHVRNGAIATIDHIDPAERALRVRTETGDRVTLPASYLDQGHVRHAYAMTIHKAQGQTADRALILGSDLLYQEAGYVALSRGRTQNRLYLVEPQPRDDAHAPETTRDAPSALVHALATSRAQHLAIDTGVDPNAIRHALIGLVHERRALQDLQLQCPGDHSYEIDALEKKHHELVTAIDASQHELEALRHRPTWRHRTERNQQHVLLSHRITHDTLTLSGVHDALQRTRLAQTERDDYLAVHGQVLQRLPQVRDEIDQRLAQLVTADAESPPPFLRGLGTPPESRAQMDRWRDAALHVERYRAEHHITDPNHPLGTRPPEERGLLWQLEMEHLEHVINGRPSPAPDLGPDLGLDL